MVEQVVGLRFVVEGEREAKRALKEVSDNQSKLTRDILRGADQVKSLSREWDKANRYLQDGTIKTEAHRQVQIRLAREYALLNGYVKANGALNTQKALAELRAAQATRDAAAAAARRTAEEQRARQSYNQLLAAINPTIAAQQRMRQAHETVRAALAAGIITRQQAAQSLRQYRNALREANLAGNRAALGMNRLGLVTQQAGYQVGDFFVQIQSGTNVMVALGQQLTQLVGVFAMIARTTRMIAIFSGIGIIVPILTAIGAAYMRTSGEAEKLNDKLEKLKSTTDSLKDAFERLQDEDLDQEFGDLTPVIQSLTENMLALNDAAQLSNLLSALDKLEEKANAGWLEKFGLKIADPAFLVDPLGLTGFRTTGGAEAILDEKAFQKLGYQMGRQTYLDFVEAMKAEARSGDRAGVIEVFDRFIEDATDAGTAAAQISIEGVANANQMYNALLAVASLYATMNGSAKEAAKQDELRKKLAGDQALEAENLRKNEERIRRERLEGEREAQRTLKANISASKQYAQTRIAGEMIARREADETFARSISASEEAARTRMASERMIQKENLDANISASKQYAQSRIAGEMLVRRAEDETFRKTIAASKESAQSRTVAAILIRREEEETLKKAIAASEEYAKSRMVAEKLKDEMALTAYEVLRIAGVDMTSGISSAALEAAKLAASLGVSLTAAINIKNLRGSKVYSGRGGDPSKVGSDDYTSQMGYKTVEEVIAELTRGRNGKEGGAGKDIFISRIAEIREMQPAIKQAQEDIENYNKEVALLDSALAKGLITQQEYNSYVDQAAEAYGQTSLAAKQYENVMLQMANTTSQAMSDAFMSIVDGTKSAKDAFSDMARIIIKKAFEMAVINPILNAIFGGVSGFTPLPAFGATAANGAAFQGGNVVPFANGGVVGGPTTFPMSAGRTGLMGEAGPEAIMPLKRGKDGKLGVVAEGGGTTVNNYFTVQANGDDSVKRIVQQQIPRIAEATKAAVVDAKRRGGSYGKAFA